MLIYWIHLSFQPNNSALLHKNPSILLHQLFAQPTNTIQLVKHTFLKLTGAGFQSIDSNDAAVMGMEEYQRNTRCLSPISFFENMLNAGIDLVTSKRIQFNDEEESAVENVALSR